MKTVPVHEAEARLSELLAAVELGEEITITRHGRPVVKRHQELTPWRHQELTPLRGLMTG
jgi:antitoxin (DNA-binding transcriptional repressor) of toxin-antitoxin stability system